MCFLKIENDICKYVIVIKSIIISLSSMPNQNFQDIIKRLDNTTIIRKN